VARQRQRCCCRRQGERRARVEERGHGGLAQAAAAARSAVSERGCRECCSRRGEVRASCARRRRAGRGRGGGGGCRVGGEASLTRRSEAAEVARRASSPSGRRVRGRVALQPRGWIGRHHITSRLARRLAAARQQSRLDEAGEQAGPE
jgi:hypothetical protein